jgi:hypothetical protein
MVNLCPAQNKKLKPMHVTRLQYHRVAEAVAATLGAACQCQGELPSLLTAVEATMDSFGGSVPAFSLVPALIRARVPFSAIPRIVWALTQVR